MNIYEKIGDFFLNIVQLIVGGIIFAAVMADDSINSTFLYVVAVISVILLFVFAIILYQVSQKKKN